MTGKQEEMRYPIGIQSFSELRENNYVYVDKTGIIHSLIKSTKYVFLSRPRRFGKSLLLSTIEALFSGRRELFKGLSIDSLDWDWSVHPVFHLDLNVRDFTADGSLASILERHLSEWEARYDYTPANNILEDRFLAIIKRAYEVTGKKVVILIDEYDKPLVRTLHNKELQRAYRNQLQAFYSVLKSLDQYIRFAMLTGVTRFSKVGIFSGLNNLKDITINASYNSICGISETEVEKYFHSQIADFAESEGLDYDQMYSRLKENYDGYHFASDTEGIYNPFSLLNSLQDKNIVNYWAETGTPTFLADLLRNEHFPLADLEGVARSEDALKGADSYNMDLVPMFFQTGYLTIKEYEELTELYILGYPNREVKKSFIDFLVPYYSPKIKSGAEIGKLVRAVVNGDTEGFMNFLSAFFADFPYEQIPDMEVHYQNVIYIIMKLMGFYVRTEYHTSQGRVDMVIDTPEYVYVIEFKLGGSPKTALKQIEEKGYCKPFEASGKKIIRLGVVFDKKTRSLKKWLQA